MPTHNLVTEKQAKKTCNIVLFKSLQKVADTISHET